MCRGKASTEYLHNLLDTLTGLYTATLARNVDPEVGEIIVLASSIHYSLDIKRASPLNFPVSYIVPVQIRDLFSEGKPKLKRNPHEIAKVKFRRPTLCVPRNTGSLLTLKSESSTSSAKLPQQSMLFFSVSEK